MDVHEFMEQLKVAKAKLETDIFTSVSSLVENFKAETGVHPDSIRIEMMSATPIGPSIEYSVWGCQVSLYLGL